MQAPGVLGGAEPLEWSGSSLATVFAQRRNLLRPGFWRMLADILRFNRLATRLALEMDGPTPRDPGDPDCDKAKLKVRDFPEVNPS